MFKITLNRAALLTAAVSLSAGALVGLAPAASASGSYETTTVANNVLMRHCPHTTKACYQTGYLAISGSVVYLYCYVTGDSVNGDKIWYDGAAADTQNGSGYIAGYFVNTGHDPHSGISKC